jgi:hypothetical protein
VKKEMEEAMTERQKVIENFFTSDGRMNLSHLHVV